MNTITLNDIAVWARIGILPREQNTLQCLRFDVSFPIEAEKVAREDSILRTVNYAELAEALTARVEASSADLIETLAWDLCQYLCTAFSLPWIELTLTKPACIHNAKSVAITLKHFSE